MKQLFAFFFFFMSLSVFAPLRAQTSLLELETALNQEENIYVLTDLKPDLGSTSPLDNSWVWSLIPGLGQAIMGEKERGRMFMLGVIAALPIGFMVGAGIGSWPDSRPAFANGLNFNAPSVLGALSLSLFVYVWNLVDAYQLNFDRQRREIFCDCY